MLLREYINKNFDGMQKNFAAWYGHDPATISKWCISGKVYVFECDGQVSLFRKTKDLKDYED